MSYELRPPVPFDPTGQVGSMREPVTTMPGDPAGTKIFNPSQHVDPPLVSDPPLPTLFMPSNGARGDTGGVLKEFGGASAYGNGAPGRVTAESMAATIMSDNGLMRFHPRRDPYA